jgi:hypothetical protein
MISKLLGGTAIALWVVYFYMESNGISSFCIGVCE